MSQSVTGGFGERVVERVVAQDTFVPATIRSVVFSEVVEYRSGPITGANVTHTAPLSVYNRREERDSSEVRSRGVAPELFLKLYVEEIRETVLIRVAPADVLQFGEFTMMNGSFTLTEEDVEVKVTADSVTIEEYGTFSRAKDVTDTRTYQSFKSDSEFGKVFDKSYQCGKEVEEKMREAWAKENGIYSGKWEVVNVDDFEYSSRAEIEVSPGAEYRNLHFTLSMDEWDENEALRSLIESVGSGLVENLEHEFVWVSMDEYSSTDVIADDGAWNLYCPSEKPNIVSRLVRKHF